MGIALIPSLLRMIDIGWLYIFGFHIGVFIVLSLLFIYKNRLPLYIKSHVLFLAFLSVAIIGLVNFKTVSGAFLILIVIGIATMVFGRKIGIIYASLFLIIYIFIGYLHIFDYVESNINFANYVNLTTTWVNQFSAFIFSILILINSIDVFYNMFIQQIDIAQQKSAQLSKALINVRESEQRYRMIFEGSTDGILFVDNDFNISSCNNAYQDIVGYTMSELKGKDYKELMPQKNINWDEYFLALADKRGNNKNTEVDIIHKSGEHIPVEVIPFKIEKNGETYLWAIVRDMKEKKELENKIFSTMVTAEETERERYAKELHDGLGPLLSTGMIYVHTIKEETEVTSIAEYAERAYSILEDATRVVREISNNLSPLILKDYGIAHAIRSFIEKANLATDIKFIIKDELQGRFQEIIETTLYRVLIELCNNTIKYSNAKKVQILSSFFDGYLIVQYFDNGDGFDLNSLHDNPTGFGLSNMKNRVNKLGGEYDFNSAVGQGVEVIIRIKTEYI